VGRVIPLDVALDRLLRVRAWRRAFAEGRLDALEVSPADAMALATMDVAELERAAARVRAEVLSRRHRGVGSLLDAFPATIAAWRAAHPEDADLDELAARFLESAAYDAHRELPFAGPGLCLEEAFFHFVSRAGIGMAEVRETELLRAVMRALVVSPDPDFLVPPQVRAVAGGFAAVGPGSTVHAAIDGRVIEGPLAARAPGSQREPSEAWTDKSLHCGPSRS
jgi:hypothetical protein